MNRTSENLDRDRELEAKGGMPGIVAATAQPCSFCGYDRTLKAGHVIECAYCGTIRRQEKRSAPPAAVHGSLF